MLVLSRKVGERVVLSDGVYLTIVAVCGTNVRLGFEAPQHIRIMREELQRRMQCEATSQSKTLKRGEKK